MNHTQLTPAAGYNTDRIVFSKIVTTAVADSKLSFKRINILTKNPDGTTGDLVLGTSNVFSYGVSANTDPTTQKVNGYNLPLCLWNKDGPSDAERQWTDTFNNIVEACKKYVVDHRAELGKYDLEISELKKMNPLYWKRDANGVVPNTGPTLYCKLIISKKNGEERILSVFNDADTGEELDPMFLQAKYCFVNAAVKIESIYIGTKISLQVKLYEAEISLCDKGMKSLLPKKQPVLTETKKEASLAENYGYDEYDEEDEEEDEAGSIKRPREEEEVAVSSTQAQTQVQEAPLPKKAVVSRKKK